MEDTLSNQSGTNDPQKQRILVLCFDGTGNRFVANETDTNIIKIYEMLDRKEDGQYHYYQPGIGTYLQHESASFNPFSKYWAKVELAVDQGVGLSFKSHVISGYKFLTKYYQTGDLIYVFGFSRGAYTARFFSEMVHQLGLLSTGNDELIHFAWTTFAEFQKSRRDNGPDDIKRRDFMTHFRDTFCRDGVGIHFLGLFDCVNSVGQFELPFFQTTPPYLANPPAKHIRHAVAIHERRVKFRPALFSGTTEEQGSDVKEVWFAGNHADIGGGWARRADVKQRHLLSDATLSWMIDEIKNLPDDGNRKLKWATDKIPYVDPDYAGIDQAKFTSADQIDLALVPNSRDRKHAMAPHDMLSFGGGLTILGVLFWWILEIIPFSPRLEYELGKWVPRYWPPNIGSKRDIPDDAVIHPSVHVLYKTGVISKSDLPQKGGDGPTITLTGQILKNWEDKRKDAKANDRRRRKEELKNMNPFHHKTEKKYKKPSKKEEEPNGAAPSDVPTSPIGSPAPGAPPRRASTIQIPKKQAADAQGRLSSWLPGIPGIPGAISNAASTVVKDVNGLVGGKKRRDSAGAGSDSGLSGMDEEEHQPKAKKWALT